MTPLPTQIWLTPAEHHEYQITRYIYVASFVAFTWDWLSAWPVEYRILTTGKFTLVKLMYIISRLSSFGYTLGCVMFRVANIEDCGRLLAAEVWFYVLAIPCTSMLFYCRLCAVYNYSKPVMVVFGISWLIAFGCSFTVPFGMDSAHIGTTKKCIDSRVANYAVTAGLSGLLNDTLVFLAISWGLSAFWMTEKRTFKAYMKLFLVGDGLPRFSKMLLKGGQVFYLVTLVMNIVETAVFLSPGVPVLMQTTFTVPNVALENSMATRLYRAIHTGKIVDCHTSTLTVPTLPTIQNSPALDALRGQEEEDD